MKEIIKAPSLLEATRYNESVVALDKQNTEAFCDDVIEQINAYIKNNNWFLNPSPTVEVRWEWWEENWKGKFSQQGIYKYAIPIIKQKIEDAGYDLFYNGGGDRVAYFTMTPKELEKQRGKCLYK